MIRGFFNFEKYIDWVAKYDYPIPDEGYSPKLTGEPVNYEGTLVNYPQLRSIEEWEDGAVEE